MLLKLFPVIDVEGLLKRIPRPERSGYISVAIMLLAFHTILNPITAGSDCGFWALRPCAVVQEEATKEEIKQAMPLYFGSGPGEPENVCHVDAREPTR